MSEEKHETVIVKLPKWTRYMLVSTVAAVVIIAGVSIWYPNFVVSKNNDIWCEFLAPFNARVDSVPNPTPEQKETAKQFFNLQDKLDC